LPLKVRNHHFVSISIFYYMKTKHIKSFPHYILPAFSLENARRLSFPFLTNVILAKIMHQVCNFIDSIPINITSEFSQSISISHHYKICRRTIFVPVSFHYPYIYIFYNLTVHKNFPKTFSWIGATRNIVVKLTYLKKFVRHSSSYILQYNTSANTYNIRIITINFLIM